MRLDHLLSREKAKAETPELIPGRSVQGSEGTERNRSGSELEEKRQRSRAEFSQRRSAQLTTALPRNSLFRFQKYSHLYRLQGSVNPHLDNCTAKAKKIQKRPVGVRKTIGLRIERRKNQATKSTGWMPWHHTPKKDVASCEKQRGAASKH